MNKSGLEKVQQNSQTIAEKVAEAKAQANNAKKSLKSAKKPIMPEL